MVELFSTGDAVGVGRTDGGLVVVPADGEGTIRSARASEVRIVAVTVSPAGSAVATIDEDGCVRLWDVASLKPRWTCQMAVEGVHREPTLTFTPDGERLLVGCGTGGVGVLRTADGALLATLRCASTVEGPVWLASTPDGYWDGSEGVESIFGQRGDDGTVTDLDAAMHSPEKVREALAGRV